MKKAFTNENIEEFISKINKGKRKFHSLKEGATMDFDTKDCTF